MDAAPATATALADLMEISSQVEAAVVLDADGSILGSTLADEAAAERLARAGRELLEETATGIPHAGGAVTQIEASLREGSLFVARDGLRTIVGRTTPHPTSGLVLYDLKTCLRALEQTPPKPRARKRKAAADA